MWTARRWARFLLRFICWGAISVAVVILGYVFVLRPWHLYWGAKSEEVSRAMPGDDVIKNPSLNTTRAITIRATPEEIWPWLVQMGSGRGGWYSYDRIDNAGRPSADRIIPELQTPLKVGDEIPAFPHGQFRVLEVEQNRYLVLGPQAVWTFALYPQSDGTTRLVERLRIKYHWRRHPLVLVQAGMIDPGDFIMMRKMLLTLKQRIEARKQNQVQAASLAAN